MIKINIDLKSEIESWGVPAIWEKLKLRHEFYNDYNTETSQHFFIIDSADNEIFEFCFSVSTTENGSIYIELDQITVNPKDRRQGIGKFYLTRLKEFCKKNSIPEIRLTPCTTGENISYENAYTDKNELENYYRRILEDKTIHLTTRH